MKLDNYAIQRLAPYMTGHNEYGANLSGRELVEFFNKFGGFRDVYDNKNGLPNVNIGLNTSKKTYAEDRLSKMNDSEGLSLLIEEIISKANWPEKCADEINEIISACGYSIGKKCDKFSVLGIKRSKKLEVKNTAVFERIQKEILSTLDKAQLSIVLAVAWFTNKELYNKLVEKKEQGLDVRIIINKDGINKKVDLDFSLLNTKKVRSRNGGIMHEKFCVIDNQIVIVGSYNWTNNAELRNAENINITENDNPLATKYSLEFKKLWNSDI